MRVAEVGPSESHRRFPDPGASPPGALPSTTIPGSRPVRGPRGPAGCEIEFLREIPCFSAALCSDRIIEEVTMPNRSAEHSLTLTVDEAAALIGVSRSTAYDLVATDELPTVRLRRRILVPASALADLLGVSLVEVYGALSRLRGRTELKYGQQVGGSNGPSPERNQLALADPAIQPPARASDDSQLW